MVAQLQRGRGRTPPASGGRRAGGNASKRPETARTSAWLVTGEDPGLVAAAVAELVNELVGGAERSLVLEDFSAEELDVAAVAGRMPDASVPGRPKGGRVA